MQETILSGCHKNADGVVAFYNADGQECVNVFEVAVQAMVGSLEFEYDSPDDRGLKPRYINIDALSEKPDHDAETAIAYLLKKAVRTSWGGLAWFYDYDVVFRGKKVLSAPWSSAFGHAYVIQALLYWHRVSGDGRYLETAEKAALFLLEGIAGGGVRHTFDYRGETMVFFEELPQENPSSILNAHLVLLEALGRLNAVSGKQETRRIFQEALRTAERLIPLYETNRWSRYDLPESVPVLFRFTMENVPEIRIADFQLQGRAVPLCDPEAFDDTREERLAGTDWGQVETVNSIPCRRIVNGTCIRDAAPAGGTLQNSYCSLTVRDIRKALLTNGVIPVLLRLYSEGEGTFSLEVKDEAVSDDLCFLPIRTHRIFPGWNMLEFELSPSVFSIPLSREYHKFHTDLLFALEDFSDVFRRYARVFQRHLFYRERQNAIKAAARQPAATADTVYISINTRCGCACKMCDIGTRDQEASLYKHCKGSESGDMAPDDYRKILDHLEGHTRAIAFIATEPLLHPEASLFFKLAAEKGLEVSVTTNSIALDRNIEILLDSSISQVWFSVDGVGAVHDRIRGVPGLFERMQKGLGKLLEEKHRRNLSRPRLFFNFTIVPPYNGRNMVEYVRFLAQFKDDIAGVSFSHMNFVSGEVADRHNREYPALPISASLYLGRFDFREVDFPAFLSEIIAAKKLAGELGLPVGFSPDINDLNDLVNFYLKPEIGVGKPFCMIPWSACEIGIDGSCFVAGRCYQIVMGNLIRQSFDEVWCSDAYRRFRSALQHRAELYLPCLRCCGSL